MILRILCLVAVLGLAPGCYVFDELDKGRDLMDGGKAKAAEEKARADARAQREEDRQAARQQESAEWWSRARSLDGAPDPELVSCRIGGKTQFMRRTDCQSRGGSVL